MPIYYVDVVRQTKDTLIIVAEDGNEAIHLAGNGIGQVIHTRLMPGISAHNLREVYITEDKHEAMGEKSR